MTVQYKKHSSLILNGEDKEGVAPILKTSNL